MLCVSAHIDFLASFNLAGFVGDERRVRARDPRRPRAMEVTTSCVPRAVPAADLRFGGVVGPFWFLRAAGDFPHDASELPGGNTGRCGAVMGCGFDKRSRTLALL